jgi:flagellar hook-length control protein FliK
MQQVLPLLIEQARAARDQQAARLRQAQGPRSRRAPRSSGCRPTGSNAWGARRPRRWAARTAPPWPTTSASSRGSTTPSPRNRAKWRCAVGRHPAAAGAATGPAAPAGLRHPGPAPCPATRDARAAARPAPGGRIRGTRHRARPGPPTMTTVSTPSPPRLRPLHRLLPRPRRANPAPGPPALHRPRMPSPPLLQALAGPAEAGPAMPAVADAEADVAAAGAGKEAAPAETAVPQAPPTALPIVVPFVAVPIAVPRAVGHKTSAGIETDDKPSPVAGSSAAPRGKEPADVKGELLPAADAAPSPRHAAVPGFAAPPFLLRPQPPRASRAPARAGPTSGCRTACMPWPPSRPPLPPRTRRPCRCTRPRCRRIRSTRAFAGDIAAEVKLMADNGLQRAELHLNPADLGPVRIELSISAQTADISFAAAHAATREGIEQALPALRELLAGQGLQLGQAGVGSGGTGQQAFAWEAAREAGAGASRAKAGARGAGNGAAPTTAGGAPQPGHARPVRLTRRIKAGDHRPYRPSAEGRSDNRLHCWSEDVRRQARVRPPEEIQETAAGGAAGRRAGRWGRRGRLVLPGREGAGDDEEAAAVPRSTRPSRCSPRWTRSRSTCRTRAASASPRSASRCSSRTRRWR